MVTRPSGLLADGREREREVGFDGSLDVDEMGLGVMTREEKMKVVHGRFVVTVLRWRGDTRAAALSASREGGSLVSSCETDGWAMVELLVDVEFRGRREKELTRLWKSLGLNLNNLR